MAHTQPTHGTLTCTTTKHLRSCTKNGTRRFPGLGDGTLARQATRLYCGAAPRARWHHHADFSGKRTFCVWRNHLWRVAVRMGKQRRCHHDRNSPPPPLPHPRMRPTLAGGNHIGRTKPGAPHDAPGFVNGWGDRTRTCNLRVWKPLLYAT